MGRHSLFPHHGACALAVLLALSIAPPGYMGHDDFAIGEPVLVRRFPLYREGDSNAVPTGGTREVQYRLVPGEAGWLIRPEKVVDY